MCLLDLSDLPQLKTNISKFQFDQKSGEPLCFLSLPLNYYLFMFVLFTTDMITSLLSLRCLTMDMAIVKSRVPYKEAVAIQTQEAHTR